MNIHRNWIPAKLVILSSLISMLLLFSSTCSIPTRDETEMLEELFNRLDAVEGGITFVTKDGETVNIKITKESSQDGQNKDNAEDTKEESSTEKDSTSKDLSGILPSLGSKEDVFKALGVWENAHALYEEGLTWPHIARE